ncbi:hypothetical protein JCM16303_003966 [Sporobolomyces ruberrimus]
MNGQNPVLSLPPPILPSTQTKLAHNTRRDPSPQYPTDTTRSSSNRGRRSISVDPNSRSRGRYERGWEQEELTERERSESRNGRTLSRVPLFRRGNDIDGRREKEAEGSAGRGWGDSDGDVDRLERRRNSSPNSLAKLGRHFIGIRDDHSFQTPLLRPLRFLSQPYENYLLAFLGSFVAILGAAGISYAFKNVKGFEGDTPLAIGSLGATAVLLYVVPESPLSQPRSVIGGHMVSALSGVIISQLFSLNSRFNKPLTEDNTVVQQNSWYHLTPVAYALAVAIAIFGMQVTKTVHPPGGATALIASAHRTTNGRYTYLLDIFLAVTWMTLWSFFINNLGRRKYPTFWWTPNKPSSPEKKKAEEDEKKEILLPLSTVPAPPPQTTTYPATQPSHEGKYEKPQHIENDYEERQRGRRLGNLEEEPYAMMSARMAGDEAERRGRQDVV